MRWGTSDIKYIYLRIYLKAEACAKSYVLGSLKRARLCFEHSISVLCKQVAKMEMKCMEHVMIMVW